MRNVLFFILLFLYGGTFEHCMAQQVNEAQVKKEIGQAAAALKTLQCDFVQTKHLKLLNDDMVSKGKMYYDQGSKLRWEYVTPYAYTFILNGDKVLLKNRNRNDIIDVNQNKIFKEIARIMMSSVVGDCLSDTRSFKTSIRGTDTEWVATLLPLRKDIKQMFQQITLHFNKQRRIVTKVELLEKNGDKTVIELKNIRTNEAVSASLFAIH